jgi:hypothetical protein
MRRGRRLSIDSAQRVKEKEKKEEKKEKKCERQIGGPSPIRSIELLPSLRLKGKGPTPRACTYSHNVLQQQAGVI